MAFGHASELKQQGVLEASRSPDNNISAEDAERAVIDEAQRSGSAAFQFDPNATAEEKARQAHARVPPGFHHERKPKALALASDVDTGTGPDYDLPAPMKPTLPAQDNTKDPKAAQANGAPPEEDSRWDRVGWAPRFGMGDSTEEDDGTTMLDHQTWLEGKLDEKFYGDWYHNTGIIIFACVSAWVIGILGGGLGWLFVILATCATYYRTSIRRVRRNFRDDVNRQMGKAKLETDTESLEWINSFLVKFWPIYAPVLCETIINSVDQVLSTSTPAFLDSLRMKTFVLGTKPPRLEHVKTYPKAQDDIVLMDWRFSFTPNDVADLTARQIKNKINPKIVLEVRVGKGVVSKGLDVIVEDMAFSGLMRVKVKLQIPFPHIEKAEICFMERPTIDYVCKPLGGDMFGFDINFIPGLESFIMEQVHANLGPMMYDPNVFPIEIAKMLAGNPVDQAIGVLQVTFHGAQGLKNPDKFSGTPDPYAVVSINGRTELGRTKTVHENANPRWSETVNVILTSLKDSLTIQIYDYNEYRKDKELGTATFALEQLESDTDHENQQLVVMANGRERGVVQADIRFFPVLEGGKLEDGTEAPPPESLTGIAKFTVEQAKDLDGSQSMIGQLNPYAVLLLNGKEVHTSQKLKRTNNPIWPNASKEMLITDRKRAKLGLVIKDDRDIAKDPIIGTYQIKLDDMLEMMARGQEWYNLAQTKSGRVKMTLQWKPVALKGVVGGAGGYVTPIGVMRLHFLNARNLPNVETMGKSDPYVRVMMAGIEKGRTVTWKNNLNPDFDEVIYVPIHSTREKLMLEVMDSENVGKDRSLGHVEVAAAEYVRQGENGEYQVHDEKRPLSQSLSTGSRTSSRGTLNFTCAFYPTLNVADPDDDEEEKQASAELKETEAATSSSSSSSSGRRSADHKRTVSRGTVTSVRTNGTANSGDLVKMLDRSEQLNQVDVGPTKKEAPKIRLTANDLQEYGRSKKHFSRRSQEIILTPRLPHLESGIIIFKLIDGDLAHTDCHLEVLMDDMVFPSYTSSKVRSKHTTFNETGDAMVRELDFSEITLRLVEQADKKGEGNDDHVIAKLKGPTLDTLRRCLYTPTQLSLRDKEGRESRITVSLKYLPVRMQLDPSESFNNSGTLRVDVLDAADLPAADRNGYSDPYCKFFLDGKEVYKTATQKKTLHPAWNEFFEVQVRSRTSADFNVTVYDYDFGDKADLLGKAAINLAILEPFVSQEVTLGLDGKSGAIRLRMLFKSDYVTRARQGSSTFHGTFAVPGKVIGAPVKGVSKGAVLVGGNVARGASFLGRGFRRRKNSRGAEDDNDVDGSADTTIVNPGPDVPQISVVDGDNRPLTSPGTATPPNNGNAHQRARSWGTQSMASASGTAQLSLATASGFPPGTKLRVHIRMEPKGKEVYKSAAIKAPAGEAQFNESFTVKCAADAQFKIVVKDHSTFGADDELGEGVFFVDDQGAGGEKVVGVGPGKVVVRSSFVPADAGSAVNSPKSGRRGVFGGKGREGRERERSVTPA
ncbi:Tricalbin-2 [Coniosporium tulheliwenetii]|uniref:Tricalbin-2 n=1 Tax=Coniosporium tulheliwenetii TaxID=3383036 RepID=A0ACC2YM59_9PEZI|nr:Tricalbin-2 [Cladosporium sp. JES 115]